jgi:hypothetical protein
MQFTWVDWNLLPYNGRRLCKYHTQHMMMCFDEKTTDALHFCLSDKFNIAHRFVQWQLDCCSDGDASPDTDPVDDSCSANSACNSLGLTGTCCPTTAGNNVSTPFCFKPSRILESFHFSRAHVLYSWNVVTG